MSTDLPRGPAGLQRLRAQRAGLATSALAAPRDAGLRAWSPTLDDERLRDRRCRPRRRRCSWCCATERLARRRSSSAARRRPARRPGLMRPIDPLQVLRELDALRAAARPRTERCRPAPAPASAGRAAARRTARPAAPRARRCARRRRRARRPAPCWSTTARSRCASWQRGCSAWGLAVRLRAATASQRAGAAGAAHATTSSSSTSNSAPTASSTACALCQHIKRQPATRLAARRWW